MTGSAGSKTLPLLGSTTNPLGASPILPAALHEPSQYVTPEFETMCGEKYMQQDEENVKPEDYVTAAPAAGKNF